MAFGRLIISLRTRSRLYALFALCLGCTALSAVYFIRYLARPNTGLVAGGLETVIRGGKVVFSPRTPFSIAEAAGLQPEHDELESVNGSPINGSLDVVRAVAAVTSFEPFIVMVRRDGRESLAIPITPVFVLSRIDWFFSLICSIALAYAAFTTTIAMSGESFSVPLVLFALSLLVFVCVKPFSYETVAANALSQLGRISAWLLLAFGLSFPSPRAGRTVRTAVVCSLFLAFLGFAAARVFLIREWMSTGAEYWLERYRLMGRVSHGLDAIAYAAFILVMAHRYSRSKDPVVRKQVPWMLAGALIALPPVFFFDQLPILLGDASSYRIGLGPFSEMFLLALPVFTIIGLTQNRVLRLKRFLSRYAVYAGILLVMFAFFSLAYLPLRDLLSSGFRLSRPMGDFFAAGVVFLFILPFGLWIASVSDRAISQARHKDSPAHLLELEARRTELELALEQVSRGYDRAVRGEKLAELRLILKGIAARLQTPFERILSVLSAMEPRDELRGELTGAVEAGVRVSGILRGIKSHSVRTFSIPSASNIDLIVRSAAESIRRRTPSARFELSPGESALISCRPEEMADAVSFVLDNALEAQDGSGGPITVRTVSAGSNVSVEIEDAGAGIGDSDWRNLFKPFFTKKPGHLGLGLYFARLIAEANGGSLEIAPIGSGGIRARFVFPRQNGGFSGRQD